MNSKGPNRSSSGFTRPDLLAVIIALALLLPLLTAATRPVQAKTTVCLGNLRGLANGMSLYAEDNRGWLPGNNDDAAAGRNWISGFVSPGSPDFTNTAILRDPTKAKLTRYLAGVPMVYHCPADMLTQRVGGTGVQARSYSLNGAVGTNPTKGQNVAVDGAWLDGAHGHTVGKTYYTYGKYTDMVAPSPSGLFTFVDEDPYSLNDGLLAVSLAVQEWIDWPATHHDFGGAFAFADGHVERHPWREQTTRVLNGNLSIRPLKQSADNLWLQQRTSAKIPR